TYRIAEHHTAGGMTRFQPYLAELAPEFFCEVSPELAAERGLEHAGWATIITARAAIEARVMVNERTHLSLDPNVHIQEVKALACDIQPGRRPRGRARDALVEQYQRRAGITERTGTEV